MNKRFVPKEERYKDIDGVTFKMCLTCDQFKEMNDEHFYKSVRNKDGFGSNCKICEIERTKKRQEANREQLIQYKRHWYRRHRKTEAEKARQRYLDPEKRQRNLERAKKFRQENRERVREYSRKRIEEERNHTISKEEWDHCKQYFGFSCAYCGLTEEKHRLMFGEQLHKEHVIYQGKNDISNCVPSCKPCNSEKNIHSLHTWYNESNQKYDKRRYMKIVQWIKYGCKKFNKSRSN